jgi:hypothetical protein
MTAATAPKPSATSLLSVYDGRCCIGFVLRCGPLGAEALTTEHESIGQFQNEDAAATALWKHAHKQPLDGGNGGSP